MSRKFGQEELREGSLINLPHSNERQRTVANVPVPIPSQPAKVDCGNPSLASKRKTEDNSEGPLYYSDNPMAAVEGNEDDANMFSLWHQNHHGSIDLGLDEKLTSMTGSYSEILDDCEQTDHEEACIKPNASTYNNEMQDCHTKLEDKRKGLIGVKEVPKGPAAVGVSKPAENAVATVPLNERSHEETVSSLVRDFMDKSSISSQPSRHKESLPRNMNATPNLPRSLMYPALPPFDPCIISDLEDQARNIATSMDTLIENLTGTLHNISALTVECVETYRDSVCKTCDAVDSNIKSMYQLMAKCEELSKSMKPVYKLHEQIKEIRRLLDLFEGVIFSGGS